LFEVAYFAPELVVRGVKVVFVVDIAAVAAGQLADKNSLSRLIDL